MDDGSKVDGEEYIDQASGGGQEGREPDAADSFLREGESALATRPALYDLEVEFARSKQNRNFLFPLVVICFLAAMIGGSFLFAAFIESRNKALAVTITEFDDVNLRDLLDTAKKNENDLALARLELDNLKAELDRQIESINAVAEKEIEIANTEAKTPEDRQARFRSIRGKEAELIAEARQEVGREIAVQEEKIASIQEQMATYDERMVTQMREQEEILGNQFRLQELQLKERIETYEAQITEMKTHYEGQLTALRSHQGKLFNILDESKDDERGTAIRQLYELYNPTFEDDAISDLLETEDGSIPIVPLDPAAFDPLLVQENVMSEADFQNLRQNLEAAVALFAKLRQVPYENSVPVALEQIDYLLRTTINEYEDLWSNLLVILGERNQVIDDQQGLIDEHEGVIFELETAVEARDDLIAERTQQISDQEVLLVEQTEEIEELNDTAAVRERKIVDQSIAIYRFEFAMDSLTTSTGEIGYIIDARDPNLVSIALVDSISIRDGDLAFVIREDDQFVGSLQFSVTSDSISARIVEIAESMTVEPFDKILLRVS